MDSAADYVADAERKMRWMILHEMRRPNDAGPALARLNKRYRLRESQIATLLYRQPADLLISVYLSIVNAYDAEIERQERILAHERAIGTAKTRLGSALLRVASALDGSETRSVIGE